MRKQTLFIKLICLLIFASCGNKNTPINKMYSKSVGDSINYQIYTPDNPSFDLDSNFMTVVYLTNLGFDKIGNNDCSDDVDWLLSQGYRVVKLDYLNKDQAISPLINKDIISINDSIGAGSFLGMDDCSFYRSYVLFEGYRIKRDVAYYKDDPNVYNSPKEYTEGDSLYMDIIYPANPKNPIPVILSFSYSNSYATWNSDKQELSAINKHQRLKQAYTLSGFNDSFLEGAPARKIAWAIADHPKYCSWGKGKPKDGPNDAYKSYQTNPDAVCKVKSAVRTLRAEGGKLGLSGEIGIYGFSRGSTAGSLAIGDKQVPEFKNNGLHIEVNDDVQAAALGPGVFDYTKIYDHKDDGDKNLELRCPWVWGELKENRDFWDKMGASYLVESSKTAPTLFFYNTTDETYYLSQIVALKAKLDSLSVPTKIVVDYGKGHSVPQTGESLSVLYDFFSGELK